MPAHRYYYSSPISPNEAIVLEGVEFHHLLHVMRDTEGEEVEVVNGLGYLYRAIIERIEKKRAILQVLTTDHQNTPQFKTILCLAIPRSPRLDFILEKGTELGMTDLCLFSGVFSEKKEISDHQLERMRAIMVAAMKQCGRLFLPKIQIKPALADWTSLDLPSYFGDTSRDSKPFIDKWNENPSSAGIQMFIGPESGFHESEEKVLQKLGAHGVKLHENILRTDTAALTALALISCFEKGRGL